MAHDTEKLRELLERCEKASGPDRELDRALHMATVGDMSVHLHMGECVFNAYTASLDASIALVERMLPGWWWVAGANDDNDECICTVGYRSSNEVGDDFEGIASTVPLAVLCSLLRALISQAGSSTLRDGLTRAEAHKMEGGSGLSSCPLQAEGEA